jgi:caffeoyl-CoA O-methyltransferase
VSRVARDSRPVTPAGILAQRLGDLCRRADELGDLDAGFVADLRAAAELAGGLEPYVERCTTPPSPALAELARRTDAREWEHRDGDGVIAALEQEMLSGHVEGQTLQFLIAATGARRVLEIGMFTGYSALAMAEALPGDGRVVACELDPDVAAFAQEGFDATPAGARIDVRVGPALATLDGLAAAGERFDLVFIDADKAGYHAYLDTLLEKELLAPGALVCVDNTLLQGEPWAVERPSANGAAIAAFNAAVAADERIVQVLLPVRDGLTLIRQAT